MVAKQKPLKFSDCKPRMPEEIWEAVEILIDSADGLEGEHLLANRASLAAIFWTLGLSGPFDKLLAAERLVYAAIKAAIEKELGDG
jgi:hypothetical protein